jgi:hypothetical protein
MTNVIAVDESIAIDGACSWKVRVGRLGHPTAPHEPLSHVTFASSRKTR